ncbi:MAG TPA: penicillin-binding protein [Bacillota bacterium]|nr:penicillin-binding protein [Bacillota bacterium]
MKKNKKTNRVAGLLIVFFVGTFSVVAGRFLYLQITGEVDGISLVEWAEEKRTSSHILDAERGKIHDANGMPLAYDRPTYRLYAIVDKKYSTNKDQPLHVKNPKKTAKKLAPILDIDESKLLSKLEKGIENEQFQVEFGNAGKHLSQKTKDKIDELELPGIGFEKESIRYYPNGVFAPHIIGFARETEETDEQEEHPQEIKGITGIEKEMDELLTGKDGFISYQRDKYNKKLLDPEEVIQKPEHGKDIYLTIDQKVQTLLEDAMAQVETEYNPERITAIVMDAKTGEVVAMGNRPSYNPNAPEDVENWYNDAISIPFEPGSTMKMFTWAAAIEEGVYKGDISYKSGSYRINERIAPIHDHNGGEGWGSITYDEGFIRSSNVATAKLVWEKIGPEIYLDYLKAFGFDEPTGIDLPGETAGQILYNWPREKVTTGFGQGTTLTPIQQMKAATAIANGGKMLQPYVIKKIVDPNTGDIIEENEPTVVGEPISEKTSKHVLDLLESAVNSKKATGNMYRLADYTVAGKTGTAQIPSSDGSGYLTGYGNNIYSFLGIAPKDDPQLIMYVSVKQPDLQTEDGMEPGSAPVSFIFKTVMENSLHYLNIEPDKEEYEKVQTVKVPEVEGKNVKEVKKTFKETPIHPTFIGEGEKVVASSVEEGTELLPNSEVIVLTDQPVMPDLTGWSLRSVLQLGDLLGIQVEATGHGFVSSQTIKKGSSIQKNDTLKIELTPPAGE